MSYKPYTPPGGVPKLFPEDKAKKYEELFYSIGRFEKHKYDMDICVMYRIMEEPINNNKNYPKEYLNNYLEQIKADFTATLTNEKKDADFYLNHFYFAVTPNNKNYASYLPLFFSVCDSINIIPLLEYHYSINKTLDKNNSIGFLDIVEFKVCDFIQRNKFPEDYYIRYDKIYTWVKQKKQYVDFFDALNNRFNILTQAINKLASVELKEQPITADIENSDATIKQVVVVADKIDNLLADLKMYFNENSHSELKKLLMGNAKPNLQFIFNGNANQLVDVFRIYCEEKFIVPNEKKEVLEWLCNHFMAIDKANKTAMPLNYDSMRNVMYGVKLPKKGSRINLTGLSKEQHLFYSKK